VTNRLALNLGVRWDLQTFTAAGLVSSPLFPPSSKLPFQPYNFAPRAGFAYSLGDKRPFVIRGGYGIFFVRIPQIYNSIVQTENGRHGFGRIPEEQRRLRSPGLPGLSQSAGELSTGRRELQLACRIHPRGNSHGLSFCAEFRHSAGTTVQLDH